jgi:hypothetical protein
MMEGGIVKKKSPSLSSKILPSDIEEILTR